MLDDFMLRALLAGLAVVLAAGPLGCIVVWRRMAYFGDATAHGSILGVALAVAFSFPIFVGVLAIALIVAFTVTLGSNRQFAADTLLGVVAHAGLALGLLALSLTDARMIDPEAILVGDIVTVTKGDLALILVGAAAVLVAILSNWNALLTATINPDLAQASGINPRRAQMVLTLSLAVLVAVAIKVVGALMITALLIIPAAAARPLVRSPEAMAVLATLIGVASVGGGLWTSWHLDSQTGPSIVSAAVLFFVVSVVIGRLRKRLSN
ncbi:metal ABC transporter permease [Halovulum sp. GXIMD14793]